MNFRLATLLRLREVTRNERRALLAEAHRADEELVRQLTQLGMEQQRSQDECRKAAAPGAVDVDRLVEAHRYVVGLHSSRRENCKSSANRWPSKSTAAANRC